ncbi:MAG: Exodeoxyribonuclease V alpha chain [uncultured Friedmanniella sp.]|uniref:RecBCD enzyme subunit RecD n=1 Tax=uncultured Friedmanniella sp. TaxID=335381 RepID=A0A6J4LS20_9ACTN|nr:exodeoxyribonuclease V subunit alpha [uncultured Friedmanniella sp.]CAA9336633.1 MAG: Exodeoxyribonuclease V alpha chain [uncultured Friedmanniella sp.]
MSTTTSIRPDSPHGLDPGSPALVRNATGVLGAFNQAGVLAAADVHTATAVAGMVGERSEPVQLALALAVRALRNGSVCVDLATVASAGFDEAEEQLDVSDLPWPEPQSWLADVAASPLVSVGGGGPDGRPLRLNAGLLYLERYWQQEEQVRTQLQQRFADPGPDEKPGPLAAALGRLFPDPGLAAGEPDLQQLAAAVSALSRVTVLAGGPGTGKTTTVARLLAVLRDQPGPPPRVALAAPTGKAAARLAEAVRAESAKLEQQDQDRVGEVTASTLHRLLGWQPGSRSRFRHDANNHLPHDVVIVDEMSMVSLTMMARLLEAVRPDARLVLVGDPDQLSSVEAGAVLADVAGAPGPPSPALDARLAALDLPNAAGAPPVRHGVVQLTRTWRYGSQIAALAEAVRNSDDDEVVRRLRDGGEAVGFVELADATDEGARPPTAAELAELVATVRATGQRTRDAAYAGDVTAALTAADSHRLLCAHRRGPFGVTRWSQEAEAWLVEGVPGYAEDGEWYVGRPLLVTANDYESGLWNGDTGVVVRRPEGLRAAFTRGRDPLLLAPVRLDAVQTVHAMTVHRAQGSQFTSVSFVVPPPGSPLLTRELLYTAVTRATERVLVLGTETAIRQAVRRPALRASGLRSRLAGEGREEPEADGVSER